ncbi:MAG: MFS transporter, partial [Clostridia bacterium]|nr:MFS transporter [Clostridia bacterium]
VHPVTPTIIVDLGLNDYMFGLAMAAMMLMNFLFSPFWGKIAGYISSKTVMLICGIGYAVGQIFFGIAQTEIQFLLARMFAGIFIGGSYVAFLTYSVNVSDDGNRGKNLAVNATIQAVSASFGYFVGGMIGEINVYWSVWLQVITLAGTSVLHYFLIEDDRQSGLERLTPKMLAGSCNPFSAILQCRKFMTKLIALIFIVYGLSNLGYIAFEQCFNFYLRDQFNLSSGYNGVIKAALGVISLVANGTLCLWIMKKKNASFYMTGVMAVCTVSMIGVIFASGMIPFIIVNVIFFAFYFVSLPLIQNKTAELGKGENSNLVMGAVNSVKSFGSIFGSALAGFIYELGAKLPFVFGFIAFFLSAVCMYAFYRNEKT